MTYGLTDIHQHLLWGLDDGPDTAQGTQDMLREAHRQGICQVAATCHACPGFVPFDIGAYRERLTQAQDFARQENLDVALFPGAEVAWTFQTTTSIRHGDFPTLGSTDYVLLELWRDVSLQTARDAVNQLIRAGYCPVLAHVERYRCFSWWPKAALRFREETGALMQSTPRRCCILAVRWRSTSSTRCSTPAGSTPSPPMPTAPRPGRSTCLRPTTGWCSIPTPNTPGR